jgi:hypothetical protein
MEIKRLLVIVGISLIFIFLFCEDIVEGSEDQTMEPETIGPETMEPETIGPETMEPETIGPETIGPETFGSETSENKMEVDEIIKLQMLQMELLKDVIKNKK